ALDRQITCRAQCLGSLNVGNDTWLWAWANDSIEPRLRSASERVRDYGKREGFAGLTESKVGCNEREALQLVAVAAQVIDPVAVFRGESDPLVVFLALYDPVVKLTDGSES
ncbi:MAG TPA: hypothetical protein VNC50_16035, partial [Planctomycetia bacterium]|nr:hypothetical protein [Planctomycetia bacterium]